MNLRDRLKASFDSIATSLLQVLGTVRVSQVLPRASPPSSDHHAVDLEAQTQPAAPAGLVVRHRDLHWAKIMAAFCMASAVDIAIVSVQVDSPLPSAFQGLSLIIIMAFASFFVSECFSLKFVVTARVLKEVGIFFMVTAFFLAITIPVPLFLKITSWVVYAICLLAIVVGRCS